MEHCTNMSELDYQINPVLMGGLVKEVVNNIVKVHLHGRLGVISIPRNFVIGDEKLEPGHDLEFYFSYIQVVENPFDYDCSDVNPNHDISPCLVGGKIVEVNDTAAKVEMMNGLGTVAVPRRWLFTPVLLDEGQDVEFYLSCMRVIGKKELPASFI